MRLLLAALIIAALLIAGCVMTGDDGTPSPSGVKKTVTPKATVTPKTTVKATVKASVKASPTPKATEIVGPITTPRCLMTAQPWLGAGPYENSMSVTFENLPENVTNASVKCAKAEKAHNETIIESNLIFKCKYPQVWTQTNEVASATAGKASCSANVVIDPLPGPEISNVIHSFVNQTAVRITWLTAPAANGSIKYGITSAMTTAKNETADWITNHDIVISKLSINKTYYYQVTSCAKNKGCSQSSTAVFQVT
ncbi:MAG: fibronectin type III domain-containing protein [Candidatus Micrarchaeota archaeon]